MITILLLGLIFLMYISFTFNNKEVTAPAFLFTGSFLFATMWAVIYSGKWELGLHLNTFLVILGGVTCFVCTSTLVHFVIKKSTLQMHRVTFSEENVKVIPVRQELLFGIICYEVLSILFITRSLIKVVGGSWSQLSTTIFIYRNATLTTQPFVLPTIVNVLITLNITLGYWFGYILIRNFYATKKVNKHMVGIVALAVISQSITGSRTYAVNTMIAIIFYILHFSMMLSTKKRADFKVILRVVLFGMIILILFRTFGMFLGRQSSTEVSTLDYLAKYCGAEIKNLDIFLQGTRMTGPIFGSQTFYSIITQHLSFFGLSTKYVIDLPFQTINGFNLGNVYTTFYPYIYDFGYIGVPIMVSIMALSSQIVYELSARETLNQAPNIFTIMYGYMISSLMMSFFSNKFYENIVNVTFLRVVIMSCILSYILNQFMKSSSHKLERR